VSSADPPGAGAARAGRLRRLVLGAGLAVGDHVAAVVDEAAARAEADALDPLLAGRAAGAGHANPGGSGSEVAVPVATSGPEVDPDLRHVVIGAATEAGERAADLLLGATHLVSATVGWVAPVTGWAWRAPMLDPVRTRTEATVRRLAERGRLEEAVARRQAHETFGSVVGAVSASIVIDGVIEDVLGRNLQPILDSALPVALGGLGDRPELLVPLVESIVGQVLHPILETAIPSVMGDLQAKPELILPLVQTIVGKALQPILDEALPLVMDDIARQPELLMPLVMGIVDEALEPLLQAALPRVIDVLNEDPDAIRSLVRDQSTGIAVEMTETVRFKAADADDRIDRIVRRVLRRKPATVAPVDPAPTQVALPAGEPIVTIEASTVAGVTAQRDGHPSVEVPVADGHREGSR
jgi:hypothetical protein